MLFAVTKKSAVELKRGVNSVEADPVVENRKVINLLQRASRLQRGSRRLRLRRLPTFHVSVFPAFRQIQPHKGFQLRGVLTIIRKTGQINDSQSSHIARKRKVSPKGPGGGGRSWDIREPSPEEPDEDVRACGQNASLGSSGAAGGGSRGGEDGPTVPHVTHLRTHLSIPATSRGSFPKLNVASGLSWRRWPVCISFLLLLFRLRH